MLTQVCRFMNLMTKELFLKGKKKLQTSNVKMKLFKSGRYNLS